MNPLLLLSSESRYTIGYFRRTVFEFRELFCTVSFWSSTEKIELATKGFTFAYLRTQPSKAADILYWATMGEFIHRKNLILARGLGDKIQES